MTRRMIMPLLAGIIGTAFLLGLGVWQVQRLAWKQGILTQIEARIGAEPVTLPLTGDSVRDRYLPVQASGDFTDQIIAVLASQKNIGPGYRIVGALQTLDGRRVLVDRGFVALDARGAVAPAKGVTVIGNLHWPDETDSWTPLPDDTAGIWFARDVVAMARKLDTEPLLIVARSVLPADPVVTPLPVGAEGIPNDHLQYAITWFSLAAIWAGMTAYLLWRIRRQTV